MDAERTIDRQLLEHVFMSNRRALYQVLNRDCSIPNWHIKDLLQEVPMRVMRYPPQQQVNCWSSYLIRIAINLANEWRERSRQCKPHISYSDDVDKFEEMMHEQTPEADVDSEQLGELITRSLETLPPRQQQCIQLHHYDGMTYKQVSKALGISMRMVLRDLTRAHASLRAVLENERPGNQRRAKPARRHATQRHAQRRQHEEDETQEQQ